MDNSAEPGHTEFELWLEFETWQDQFDRDDEFCNLQVTISDGSRYALNVWTYKFLSKAITDCKENGEGLGGKYLFPPDLFVERLDRELLEEVVSDLIACGQMKQDWLVDRNP